MATLINSKIGVHKNKPRVYLQGRKLARQGVTPGQYYNVGVKNGSLMLTICEHGKYKVSRRKEGEELLPVIDLRVDQIAELFDGVEMIRAAVKDGKIVISAHHQSTRTEEREERFARKILAGEPLDVCSLFHGGGVLDKALHHGLASTTIKSRVAVAVELESKYLESSLRNNPELFDERSVVVESPLQSVNVANAPQADMVVAGIPCTGASKSGRSKNALEYAESHDEAGALFFSALQFIQAVNPALVVLENVPEYAGTASMVVIRSVLASLGYNLQEVVLGGNAYGALESRKRLAVLAVSKGIEIGDLNNITPVAQKPERLADVLETVDEDSPRWKDFSYLADKEVRDKAAGKGFARQLLTGEESACGTIGKGYAKCRSTEPFIVHPLLANKSRILTPAEHAAVKGIPTHVVDGLSETVAHEVLGQSVIYPVFEAMGRWIGRSLLGMMELMMLDALGDQT